MPRRLLPIFGILLAFAAGPCLGEGEPPTNNLLRAIHTCLENLADPIVIGRERGLFLLETDSKVFRTLSNLQAYASHSALPAAEIDQQAALGRFRSEIDGALKSSQSRLAGYSGLLDAQSAATPEFVTSLLRVVASGNDYLRVAAPTAAALIRSRAQSQLQRRMAALETAMPAEAAKLRAAFATGDPGLIDDLLVHMPSKVRSVVPELTQASREADYFRYLGGIGSVGIDKVAVPAPGLSSPKAIVASDLLQVREAALTALAEIPIVRKWAQPRLKELRSRLDGTAFVPPETQGDPKFERLALHAFFDSYGTWIELEEIADRYFGSSCETSQPGPAVMKFLGEVVSARGHSEAMPETLWEKIRRGKVQDAEALRYGRSQYRTAILDGHPALSGTYQSWADLDHFAQSLANAATASGGLHQFSMAVAPRQTKAVDAFAQALRSAVRSAASPLTFGMLASQDAPEKPDVWRGNPVSEWLSHVQNEGWSRGKRWRLIGGSNVDERQLEAGDRGIAYARALRVALGDRKLGFCQAIGQRAAIMTENRTAALQK